MWNFVNRLFNREQQKPAAEADPSIYKQQPWDLWAEDPQAAFEQANAHLDRFEEMMKHAPKWIEQQAQRDLEELTKGEPGPMSYDDMLREAGQRAVPERDEELEM